MRDRAEHAGPGETIELAAVADFDLGVLRVQPSLRRVGTGARGELVEPRVMQALIALAEAAGTVVSRDALIDRCWGGRIVGDDAINRCIAKVRKLAETNEPPAYTIETVSKVGYLLRLPHAPEPTAAVATTLPPSLADAFTKIRKHPSLRAWRWAVWCVLGITAIAGAAAALRHMVERPRWTVQSSRKLPRLFEEGEPRISPNGAMLAYVTDERDGNGRVYVRAIAGGTPVPVSPPDENAASPTWNSDSTRLAYVVTVSLDSPCRIMVATVPGGTPSLAGRCRQASETDIAWQPGTPYLFLVDQLPVLDGQLTEFFNAIFRFNIETGRSEQVTSPLASEEDSWPRVSPDGAWVAYIRDHGLAGAAIRLRNLLSSEERELDCDPDTRSIDWTSDSQTLLASVAGPLGSKILACPADGTQSYSVYASASGMYRLATGPSGMFAVQDSTWSTNLARAQTTRRATADIIDRAAGRTDWPTFAPDGTLAFVSDRSGETALWIRKPGQAPVRLVSAGEKDIERPVWSPDGSRLAFVEISKGDITAHIVTAQGEDVASFQVPSIGFGQPNWAPDGEHLLLFDKRILQTVSVDLRHTNDRRPVTDPFRVGIIYHNGAVYSTSGIKPGIWQINGAARLVTGDYPAARRARLAFSGDDVLLPAFEDSKNPRILAQPLKGGQERVAYYAPGAENESPLAVDPRTGDVLYVSEVYEDSSIELFTIAKQ